MALAFQKNKTLSIVEVKKQTGVKGIVMNYMKNVDLMVLLLPTILCLVIFSYIPMGGIIIAFKDYNLIDGIWASKWVGLENFKDIFNSLSFMTVLKNTLIISILRMIIGFPAPIILAIMINEVSSKRYKKLVQTVSYLPHFLSWVVLAGIFIQFLSPSDGPINYLLKLFGVDPIYFLGDTNWFVSTLIVTGVWQSIGWGSIVYLAAISSIPSEQYESALIDGAGRLQQIWYITLPSIAPAITVMLILNTGNILNAGFDQIFNLYSPAVYSVADVIDTYVYRQGFISLDYSFATAVGLFKNVIGFIFVVSTNMIVRRINDYSLW